MKNISYLLVMLLSMTINTANATGIGPPEGMWVLIFSAIAGLLLVVLIMVVLPVYLYKKHEKKSLLIIVPLLTCVIFFAIYYITSAFGY